MAGQIGNLNPGKNQDPIVTQDQMQQLFLVLETPADPAIARGQGPGGRGGKQQTPQAELARLGNDKVAKMRTDRLPYIMHTIWKPSRCTTVGTRCLDVLCLFGAAASTVMVSASIAKLPTAEFAFFRNGCYVR